MQVLVRHRNRMIKKNPKRGWFWCGGCDANLVEEGRKCTECGWKPARRTGRKSDNFDLKDV